MSVLVLREAWQRVTTGERVALATLVATRGSTPQKVGARLLVRGDGSFFGTLGGGGVEAEAAREAALRLGWGTPVLREYALSSSTDEWGLACGGTMVVFIEPLDESATGWLRAVTEAAEGGEPLALLTVVDGAENGARLLVREGGVTGTLRDPAAEAEAAAVGRRVLAREDAELVPIAGERLYAEAFGPEPALVIVGAGHVGKALAALGKLLDLRVTVIDDRPEYASRDRFPEADDLVAGPVGETLGRLAISPRTAVVVAMRNQDLDYEATAAALGTRARYVGLIGSRRKAVLIAERLLAAGVPAERVRALRSPIGLDIGARTPAEIALSILGEWMMLRQGASGTPLRLDDELFAKAHGRAAPSGVAHGGH
jgi:xanthine dehydrogenase accessory factor